MGRKKKTAITAIRNLQFAIKCKRNYRPPNEILEEYIPSNEKLGEDNVPNEILGDNIPQTQDEVFEDDIPLESRRMLKRFKLKQAVIRLRRIDEINSIIHESSQIEASQQSQPTSIESFAKSELSGFPCKQSIRAQSARCDEAEVATRSQINHIACESKLKQTLIDLQNVPLYCLQNEPSSSVSNEIKTETDPVAQAQNHDLGKELKSHGDAVHGKQKQNVIYCEDVLPPSSMPPQNSEKPTTVHSQTLCSFCTKDFITKNRLAEHMVVHTKEKPFKCKICNVSFSWRKGLASHTKKIHKDKDVRGTANGNGVLRFPSPKNTEVYNTDCERVFPTRDKLLIYSKRLEPIFNCKYCDGMFRKRSSLSLHLRTQHQDIIFHCSLCFKYIDLALKGPHMDSHNWKPANGSEVFICKVCGRQFDSTLSLDVHYKDHRSCELHEFDISNNGESIKPEVPQPSILSSDSPGKFLNGEEPEVQSKSYSSNSTQRSTLTKGFHCSFCNFFFARKSLLNNHLKLHTSRVRTYKCPDCELSFLRNTQLMRHLGAAHLHFKLPDITSNTCNVCGRVFSGNSKVLKHLFTEHMEILAGQSTSTHIIDPEQNFHTTAPKRIFNSQTSNESSSYSPVDPYRDEVQYFNSPQPRLVSPHRNEEFQRTIPALVQYQGQAPTTAHYFRTHIPQSIHPNPSVVQQTGNPVQIDYRALTQISTHNFHNSHLHLYPNDVLRRSNPENPEQIERRSSNHVQFENSAYLEHEIGSPAYLENEIANANTVVKLEYESANHVQMQNQEHSSTPTIYNTLSQESNPQHEVIRSVVVNSMNQLVRHRILEKSKLSSSLTLPKVELDEPEEILGI